MTRKNYIIFIRHLKKIKDLADFYEYIRDYGVFVVTKDVYEKVKVGDEVMM